MSQKYRLLHLAAIAGLSLYLVVGTASPARAMHIMEGFLPVGWAVFWWAMAIPFFVVGMRSLARIARENPELKLLLALGGAFSF
ncbi:MAG: energy-coupling factor ABC transporter permease, partial [Cyanobacteriota bacterium]|nr:energy-coupling factor ABC transporter permease [Cyanobacteriota bacterium]